MSEATDKARALVAGLITTCPACGSKPGVACYGNGPMRSQHPQRDKPRIALNTAAPSLLATLADEVDAAESARDALLAEVERLRATLEDFAGADCYYGDGCPTFGTRHGTCGGCKARQALRGES